MDEVEGVERRRTPRRNRRSVAAAGSVLVPAAVVAVVVLVVGAPWGWADADAQTSEVREVIDRLRLVIISLATALATLLLTVGGLRWLLAGGDPGEVDKAKRALTGAAIGYGIAILATVLVGILDWVVGTGA
jgi:fumarate reductase subunit D